MITEAMLRTAAARSCGRYTAALEQRCPETDHVFSGEFEAKIARLQVIADRKPLVHLLQRVAALLLAILVAGSAWLMADVQARARLQGWSRETKPGAVTYRKSSVFIPETEISRFGLGWVPEGYTLQRERVFGSSFSLMYSNEQGQLLWVRCAYAGNVMIAADQSVAEPCIVSGREGEFFRSNDPKVSSNVVWIDAQGRLLGVTGFFSKEELIRLAESIYEK